MPNENKTCYETAEQNLFTRFEDGIGGVYLLPYSGLLFAHLPPASCDPETLALTYVTHTVRLKGKHLFPLLLVIQKGRAESIRVAGWELQDVTKSIPTVREIIVTEGTTGDPYEKS